MTGVLIVGNGNHPPHSVLESFVASSPVIIALDGAAIMLQQQQIQPDVIIGDMDSLTSEQLEIFQSQGIKIVKDSTQDTSCLLYTSDAADE